MSAAEFAAELGVSPRALSWWKWQLGKKETRPPKRARRARTKRTTMTPLTFVEMATTTQREPLEVVLASGARIRVPADFDAATLGRVLDVLDKRR